jgi:hypothetical protein
MPVLELQKTIHAALDRTASVTSQSGSSALKQAKIGLIRVLYNSSLAVI